MKQFGAVVLAILAGIAAHPAAARHRVMWNKDFQEVRVASKLKVAECGHFRGRPLSSGRLLSLRQRLPECPQFSAVPESHEVKLQGQILFYVVTRKQDIRPGEYKIDPASPPSTTVDLVPKMYPLPAP